MKETFRIFGFTNLWPGKTCVPLQIVLIDGSKNFYFVAPADGLPCRLVKNDGTNPKPHNVRSRDSFVSAEGTPHEMKDWREGQVAYLDRHGNPRVDRWKNLITIMKEDLPYVVGHEHRRLLEDILEESV